MHNLARGMRRAQIVKNFLVVMDISEDRISVVSRGEMEPAVPDDSRANRALNRRVCFTFAWEPERDAHAI